MPRFVMVANILKVENEIVDQAISWIRARLPVNWKVERSSRVDLQGLDASIELTSNTGTSAMMLVEAKKTFTPATLTGCWRA